MLNCLHPPGNQLRVCGEPQAPSSVHTVATQWPHSGHTVATQWPLRKRGTRAFKSFNLLNMFPLSSNIPRIYSGHCVATVWPLSGHCVDTAVCVAGATKRTFSCLVEPRPSWLVSSPIRFHIDAQPQTFSCSLSDLGCVLGGAVSGSPILVRRVTVLRWIRRGRAHRVRLRPMFCSPQ